MKAKVWPEGLAIRSMMHALDFLPHGHFIVEFTDDSQIEFDNFGQLGSFIMHRERAVEAKVDALMREKEELIERAAQILISRTMREEFTDETVRLIRALVREQNTTRDDLNSTTDLNGGANTESAAQGVSTDESRSTLESAPKGKCGDSSVSRSVAYEPAAVDPTPMDTGTEVATACPTNEQSVCP